MNNIFRKKMTWIIFNQNKESIINFLNKYKPSKIPKTDCPWICVNNCNIVNDLDDNNIQKAVNEWHLLKENKKQISFNDINNIAEKYNILSGKWLIYEKTSNIDKLWANISINCVKGFLGPTVKVSPKCNYNDEHVICVFTKNYLDKENVYNIRDVLKKNGINNKISYKPDIFTYFEIYKNNKWNIKSSIYTM